MSINIHGDLNAVMAELIPDIGQAFPLLNEERGIGMAEVMNADTPYPCLIQTPVKDSRPEILLVEDPACARAKHPSWQLRPPATQGLSFALGLKALKHAGELLRHIHPPRFAIFG